MIAHYLGIDRLAVGEVEAKNFARELGVQVQHVFSGKKRKIGLPVDHTSMRGVYCYTFNTDHNETYVFNIDSVLPQPTVEQLAQRAVEVCDYIEKKKKFGPEKKYDIGVFLILL
jgi:hypothetical protein